MVRLLDPTIPATPPLSQRARRAARPQLQCPYCGGWYLALANHTYRAHGIDATTLRTQGVATLTEELVQRRRAPKPRLPARPLWVREGLSIPHALWPADCPYARLVVGRISPTLTLAPARQAGPTTRALHRSPGRTPGRAQARPVLRIEPASLLAYIQAHCLAIRAQGGAIVLQLDPEVDWMPLEYWIKYQRPHLAPARVLPSQHTLMIADKLWPRHATHAALAWVTDQIWVLPVTAEGRIAQRDLTIGRAPKAPVALAECYKIHRSGRRVMIQAQSFLTAYAAPPGEWGLVAVRPEGHLVFEPVKGGSDADHH